MQADDDESFKEDALDWMNHRDKLVLEELRTQGFCLAFLPPIGPPANAQLDFTVFLPGLDGSSNLVVAAPNLTREIVERTIEELPHRQFADGMTFQVADRFIPAPENWFRFQTEIVYIAGVGADPPLAQRDMDRVPWAYCASLKIRKAGTEARLRVIHLGLGPGRDPVYLQFLAPNALVPRRVLM